eukprot:15358209-Ditylum_brightwellii.AAC.2
MSLSILPTSSADSPIESILFKHNRRDALCRIANLAAHFLLRSKSSYHSSSGVSPESYSNRSNNRSNMIDENAMLISCGDFLSVLLRVGIAEWMHKPDITSTTISNDDDSNSNVDDLCQNLLLFVQHNHNGTDYTSAIRNSALSSLSPRSRCYDRDNLASLSSSSSLLSLLSLMLMKFGHTISNTNLDVNTLFHSPCYEEALSVIFSSLPSNGHNCNINKAAITGLAMTPILTNTSFIRGEAL